MVAMKLLCRAVASYFYSRPPLAIFLASVLTMAVTTLGLALYCHYNTDLLNVDVLDWSKLTAEMSKLKYCLQANITMTRFNTTESLASATQANLPLEAGLGAEAGSRLVSSVGNLSLALLGLGAVSQDNITVRLQHPATLGQGAAACVRVEARQPGLVTSLRNGSVGQAACLDTGHVSRVWTAHSARHVPHTWCSKPGQQVFQIKFGQVEGMETFLTQQERNVMYSHLMVTSLLLVLACAGVLVWAAVAVTRDTARDMTLLPSEADSDREDF